jgi:hypothetical protein
MDKAAPGSMETLAAKLLYTVVAHGDDGIERDAQIGGYVEVGVATTALLQVIAAINTQTEYGRSLKGQRVLADGVRSELRAIMKAQIENGFNPFHTVFEAPEAAH